MRKLNHPNIVRLIERYEEKSLLMIAMELCEEETLQKKLFKEGNTVNQTEY
jgi:serine/threonine protein kinase